MPDKRLVVEVRSNVEATCTEIGPRKRRAVLN
jgi:hypothetical protein